MFSSGSRLADIDPKARKNLAVAAAAAGIGVYAALIMPMADTAQTMQVVKCYGCVIAGFLAAFFIFKVFSLIPAVKVKIPKVSEQMKGFLLTVAALSIPVWAMFSTLDVFVEYDIVLSVGGYAAITLGSAALGALIMFGAKRSPKLLGRAILIVSLIFTYGFLFLFTFWPNTINTRFIDIHHYTAIDQTIFNVAFNEPFSVESSVTYGHYAIFMWPILKIFGHTPIVITWIYTVCNYVMETAFVALVFKMTKRDVLRAVAILSGNVMCLWPFLELPVYSPAFPPLRMMWHMIILVYMLYGYDSAWFKKSPKRYYILGYVLCSLALTWQTEFGLVAVVAFTVGIWIRHWRTEPLFSKSSLSMYALTVFACLCAIAGMVGIINIYNLLCGGPFVLLDCFYPIIGGEGFITAISHMLNSFGDCWIVATLFFIGSTMLGLFQSRFLRITRKDLSSLAICGVMGLGESAYLFGLSYPAWIGVMLCLVLCFVQLIELILSATNSKDAFYKAIQNGVGAASAVFLGMSLIVLVLCTPRMIEIRDELNVWSMDSMNELSDQVESSVPKDTYAVGYYTQDVYANLGWDPGYHKRDPANFAGIGAKRSQEEIAAQDTVLAGKWSEHMFTEDMGLVITRMIPEEDTYFYYMEKYEPVAEAIDDSDIALDKSGDVQEVRIPIELKGNTMYKVEVVVNDEVDLKAEKLDIHLTNGEREFTEQEAQSHTWSFLKNVINSLEYTEEEYERLVDEADSRHCFYIQTGDLDESAEGLITVSAEGVDEPVTLDKLLVTELRRSKE